MINDFYLDAEMESWEKASDNDCELVIGKLEGVPDVTELRIEIDYPVRLIWLCGRHDHRWRLTAWLCQLRS